MKIIQEDPGRMVLKDHNISHFVGGLVAVAAGIAVILFMTSESILVPIIGGLFVVAGAYVLATTKIINISLNKTTMCTFSMWKLLGKESRECSMGDINSLTLEKSIHGGKNKTTYKYVLAFGFKDGSEMLFDFGSVSAGIADVFRSPHEKKKKEAQQIADFIGVPLKEIGPPDVSQVLASVKKQIEESAKVH